MSLCRTCGGWDPPLFGGAHVCPPTWLVWRDEDGCLQEDADEVCATSAESAVEKWADENDGPNDSEIIRGNECAVLVCLAQGGPTERFIVSGEVVPSYTARPAPKKEVSNG